MSESVLIATTNKAKAERIRWVLDGLDWELRALEPGHTAPPDETGRDFQSNAELKACYWSQQLGGLAAASDGGW